jgi:hypothetical protein
MEKYGEMNIVASEGPWNNSTVTTDQTEISKNGYLRLTGHQVDASELKRVPEKDLADLHSCAEGSSCNRI